MEKQKILDLIKKEGVKMVDMRFMDFPGMWQHISIPAEMFDADVFEEGLGFDGSSMRGWKAINESDMLLIPDPTTAFIDPFYKERTLVLICDIRDPITKADFSRDPRWIAKKAINYLKGTGIGDEAYFGPEAEFFIFDSIRFDQQPQAGYFFIDSDEGIWNSGREEEGGNKGYKIRHKEGYFPVPPTDQLQDLRTQMTLNLQKCGVTVEAQHHEVSTAGQSEIDMQFDKMLATADKLMIFKYVIKNTAAKFGKTATFMPKPIFGDNGSGMHTHQSIWKNGKNLFAGTGYAGMSDIGLYYIGGILKHAKALIALTNPTTNSYKRLVPGFEAPTKLAYSSRNRSAAVRIPMYSSSPKAKRIEFRTPDATCNPYIAFAAMLMAGLDGIQNKIHPGEPMDKNIYDLPAEELANIPAAPRDLEEALNFLKEDYDFLLKGDVFTKDVIETWINYKTEREVQQLNLRPHPYEFYMYYDI